jgi:hypothetical protein
MVTAGEGARSTVHAGMEARTSDIWHLVALSMPTILTVGDGPSEVS